MPFYNEHVLLPVTLHSLTAQTRQTRIIPVDNGSNDGSGALAEATCRHLSLDHLLVTDHRPGKVFALDNGLKRVRTAFVATCDADTWYPTDYLAQAERLLARDGAAAAGAYYAVSESTRRQRLPTALHINVMGRLLSWQWHAGGAGQVFRTDKLRRAGGGSTAVARGVGSANIFGFEGSVDWLPLPGLDFRGYFLYSKNHVIGDLRCPVIRRHAVCFEFRAAITRAGPVVPRPRLAAAANDRTRTQTLENPCVAPTSVIRPGLIDILRSGGAGSAKRHRLCSRVAPPSQHPLRKRSGMTRFRFFLFDAIGRLDRAIERDCRDEAEAIAFAEQACDAATVEIWSGRTMVMLVVVRQLGAARALETGH